DEIGIGPVAAGLVIRDAQRRSVGTAFDQVDRSAEDEALLEHDRFRQAARIAPLVAQAEAELEILGNPSALLGKPPCPDAEIAADVADLVLPHALDGGCEIRSEEHTSELQ